MANTAPIFVLTPVAKTVAISSANTARDGSGTMGTVCAAGTAGTRIDRVNIKSSAGTTTAGMIRLFVDDAVGTRLIAEVAVTAGTPSSTVKTFEAELVRTDALPWITIPSGYKLFAATHNAEAFNVTAHGGDY